MYTQKIDEDLIKIHIIDRKLIKDEITLSKDDLLSLYEEMLKIRKFEEMAFENYNQMRGFLHLCIGQESIYSSILLCLKKLEKDWDTYLFIGSYRCHALAYITGSSLYEIASELLGRKDGMCKGKGGSMHLYNSNFFGGHGIVGAQVSLGNGLAFGLKYAKDMLKINSNLHSSFINDIAKKRAVFAFFGDGAANQGQVYESYNMALVYKLPIVFVIENNSFGMWTKNNDVSDTDDFYSRWKMMPGLRVVSDDVAILTSIMQQIIVDQAYELPMILQIDTYRHCGHSMNDKEKYRTESEKKNWLEKDKIKNLRTKLLDLGLIEEVKKLENMVESEISNCWKKALKCDLPSEKELYTDIYKN